MLQACTSLSCKYVNSTKSTAAGCARARLCVLAQTELLPLFTRYLTYTDAPEGSSLGCVPVRGDPLLLRCLGDLFPGRPGLPHRPSRHRLRGGAVRGGARLGPGVMGAASHIPEHLGRTGLLLLYFVFVATSVGFVVARQDCVGRGAGRDLPHCCCFAWLRDALLYRVQPPGHPSEEHTCHLTHKM